MNFFSKMKQPGATVAGIFSLALGSVVLLCGAVPVPVEDFSPVGPMQADLNVGGHNLTNVATVSATNIVVSGSLTAANLGSAATNAVSAFAPATGPFPWAGVTGAPALQAPITLTTNGTGGAATFSSGTLNIPQYAGGVTSFNTRTGAITLQASDLAISGAALTAVPSNAALYPTLNQNTTGSAAMAGYATNAGYSTNAGTAGSVPLSGVTGLGSGVAAAATNAVNAAGGIAGFTTYPTQYLVSILDDNNTTGPRTFVSTDGSTLSAVEKSNGTMIYTTAAFRDPRMFKIGNTYYLFYTATSLGSVNDIGLAVSTDLANWTTVTTPNWSSYFLSGQTEVANGCCYGPDGSGNYWLYFATGPGSFTTNVTPWVVRFNPNGASSTFGTPAQVLLGSTRTYADVMKVWQVGSIYYGLLQSTGTYSGTTSGYAFTELLSNTGNVATGTWTIAGAGNFAGWGSNVESGSAVQLPNGNTRVYFCDHGGGKIYSSDSNGTGAAYTTSTWTSPATIGSFSGNAPYQKCDWIDVVPFNDAQTDQALNALEHAGGGGVVTQGGVSTNPYPFNNFVTSGTGTQVNSNLAGGGYLEMDSVTAPYLSAGQQDYLGFGQSESNANMFWLSFFYNGNANAQNHVFLGLKGYPGMEVYKSGDLAVGGSSDNLTDLLQVAGTGSFTGALKTSAPQTTVNGSTAGSAVFCEPFQGSSYKKVVIELGSSLSGTASYTFPAAFSNTPMVVNSDAAVTSLSTTAVTVTGTLSLPRTVVLEGY